MQRYYKLIKAFNKALLKKPLSFLHTYALENFQREFLDLVEKSKKKKKFRYNKSF